MTTFVWPTFTQSQDNPYPGLLLFIINFLYIALVWWIYTSPCVDVGFIMQKMRKGRGFVLRDSKCYSLLYLYVDLFIEDSVIIVWSCEKY